MVKATNIALTDRMLDTCYLILDKIGTTSFFKSSIQTGIQNLIESYSTMRDSNFNVNVQEKI